MPGAPKRAETPPRAGLARSGPSDLVTGRLRMHRDGYGFVIPNPGQRSTINGDIYIGPGAIGSAMHGDQVLVELGRRRDDGRYPLLACGVDREGEILRHQISHEPRCVLAAGGGALDDPRDRVHVFHDPGGARGFRDDIGQDLRVDAKGLADAERLGDRDEGRARDQIVAQLGNLAGADTADMDDARTHRCQYRARFFEIRSLTADHDRQRPRHGAADTARTSPAPPVVRRSAPATDTQNRCGSRSPGPVATHAARPPSSV